MNRALRILVTRLVGAVPTLALVVIAAFALLSFAPGDAVDAYFAETGGAGGTAGDLRARWGLGGSGIEKLIAFAGGVLRGQFGHSIVHNRQVLDVILERLPTTMLLMALALALATLIGGVLGIAAGARPGGARDRILSTTALALNAIPNFWLGLLLILLLAVRWPLLPVGGLQSLGVPLTGLSWALDRAAHLILPTLALGLGYVALSLRSLRAGMVETWRADHVRAARARGLPERSVIWRAVARPALLPVVVLIGQQAGTMLGGSVVVETVFAIPGMGRLAYEAVSGRDPALLMGVALTSSLFVVAANLIVDLLLVRLDPRIGAAHA
ncbi:ABC transporter permease [Terrarubrum flagellatum]|uniref:ABC transporter permease n=1 Tax=Terrirubrum flagellatum TaxID=2895980 RepID=UPI003144DFE3